MSDERWTEEQVMEAVSAHLRGCRVRTTLGGFGWHAAFRNVFYMCPCGWKCSQHKGIEEDK